MAHSPLHVDDAKVSSTKHPDTLHLAASKGDDGLGSQEAPTSCNDIEDGPVSSPPIVGPNSYQDQHDAMDGLVRQPTVLLGKDSDDTRQLQEEEEGKVLGKEKDKEKDRARKRDEGETQDRTANEKDTLPSSDSPGKGDPGERPKHSLEPKATPFQAEQQRVEELRFRLRASAEAACGNEAQAMSGSSERDSLVATFRNHSGLSQTWTSSIDEVTQALRSVKTDELSPDIVNSIGDFAMLLDSAGELARAEIFHRQKLLYRGCRQPVHALDSGRSALVLAQSLEAQQKFEEADQMYQQALGSFEQVYEAPWVSREDLLLVARGLARSSSEAQFPGTSPRFLAEAASRATWKFGGNSSGSGSSLPPSVVAGGSSPPAGCEKASRFWQGRLFEAARRVAVSGCGLSGQDSQTLLEILAGTRRSPEQSLYEYFEEQLSALSCDKDLSRLEWSIGKLGKATLEQWRAAFQNAKESLPQHHPSLTRLKNDFALVLKSHGHIDEAILLLQEALEANETAFGPKHPSVLIGKTNLASLLQRCCKLKEAASLYRFVLSVRESTLGPDHHLTLTACNNLGTLRADQGRFTDAEALLQRALKGRTELFGPLDPQTLTVANNLGCTLRGAERYQEAVDILADVFLKQREVLGAQHPASSATLHNLALAQRDLGLLEEAEENCRSALEGLGVTWGGRHPESMEALHTLTSILERSGELQEAEALLCRIVLWREERYGSSHFRTLAAVMNLVCVREDLGRIHDAVVLCRYAMERYERTLGEKHVNTLVCAHNLACLLELQGKNSEAHPLYLRVLDQREAELGKNDLETSAVVVSIGVVLERQSRFEEAIPFFRRAAQSFSDLAGPTDPQTLGAVYHLAVTLRAMGELDEAEELFRSELAGCEVAYGTVHGTTLASVRNLAQFLESRCKLEEAESLFQRELEGLKALGDSEAESRCERSRRDLELLREQQKQKQKQGRSRQAVWENPLLVQGWSNIASTTNDFAGWWMSLLRPCTAATPSERSERMPQVSVHPACSEPLVSDI
mmetsp:Transcript_96200/g.200952  ORF Transcript_96200/g.200952 Transcript_96200/m.200952 type:complete len:1029 (+) Transcript_96200:31-3117(+)